MTDKIELEVNIIAFSWNNQQGIDDAGRFWSVSALLDDEGDELTGEPDPIKLEDVALVILWLDGVGYATIVLSDYELTAGMN